MVSRKICLAFFIGMKLGLAQTINISGSVEDSAGVGISEATVILEDADISTTTEPDGSFTLTNDRTALLQNRHKTLTRPDPVQLQNGKLKIRLSINSRVTVNTHNVAGRKLFSSSKVYGAGTHILPIPVQASCIYFYRVTIGSSTYSFKAFSFGKHSNKSKVNRKTSLSKHAEASEEISDVISVTKEGLLDYRDSILTSDTNEIVIKMIPNEGNLTVRDTADRLCDCNCKYEVQTLVEGENLDSINFICDYHGTYCDTLLCRD